MPYDLFFPVVISFNSGKRDFSPIPVQFGKHPLFLPGQDSFFTIMKVDEQNRLVLPVNL